MSRIDGIEVHEFTFDVVNLGLETDSEKLVYNIGYKPNATLTLSKYAVVVKTDDGLRGEYVTHWVGTKAALAQTLMLAPALLGRDAEEREGIYDDFKREIRQYDHMGHGPLDIALWDLAGKKYGTSVSRLLGGFRKRLPAYASTYMGDRRGGLDSTSATSSTRAARPRGTAASTWRIASPAGTPSSRYSTTMYRASRRAASPCPASTAAATPQYVAHPSAGIGSCRISRSSASA